MTEREINSAVARATGESKDIIARMGFQLDSPADAIPDDGLGAKSIDWDTGHGYRPVRTVQRLGRAAVYA